MQFTPNVVTISARLLLAALPFLVIAAFALLAFPAPPQVQSMFDRPITQLASGFFFTLLLYIGLPSSRRSELTVVAVIPLVGLNVFLAFMHIESGLAPACLSLFGGLAAFLPGEIEQLRRNQRQNAFKPFEDIRRDDRRRSSFSVRAALSSPTDRPSPH